MHSAAVKGVLGRFVGEATWSLTPIVAMLVQRLQLRVFSPMDQASQYVRMASRCVWACGPTPRLPGAGR